ncbi:hypothetical protein Tco_0115487 [Tanacetum coccineum]
MLRRTMAGVDVNTLTKGRAILRHCPAEKTRHRHGVIPKIGSNDNISQKKIKSQFMCKLKEDTFSGNKDKDAHDHIDRVISIVGLFNIPGVTKDAVML